jgi:hypothetical protein
MHDGPQKLMTTGEPRRSARLIVSPSSVCPVIGGAGWPSRPPPPLGRLSATNATTPTVVTTATVSARRI